MAADALQSNELRQQAKQTVDRFVRRFDESYRLLAYHAALPLVLTPELVNYLRNEFLRNEKVPWVAEIDLLLSDLCSQVGYELYAIDTHVRGYLLEQMKNDPRFGERRMREVAEVLYSYVNYLSRLNPGIRQKELEAQRLAAMVYLGDEECQQAAQEIARRLLEVSSGMGDANLDESGIRAELARLTRITEELAPQLQQEPSLLEYANLVQKLLRIPEEVTATEINRSYQVGEVELSPVSSLSLFPIVAETARFSNISSVTSQQEIPPAIPGYGEVIGEEGVLNLEDFPPLENYDFEIANIAVEDGDFVEEGETPIPNDEESNIATAMGISLEPFEYDVAIINQDAKPEVNLESATTTPVPLDTTVTASPPEELKSFEFETVTVNSRGKVINRQQYQASYFVELLDKTQQQTTQRWSLLNIFNRNKSEQTPLGIEMVAIPGGSFEMGSPENEAERFSNESPLHRVTVQPFFMGKYPVTQAQWRFVAQLPQIHKELKPDPSRFKGDNFPVEQVSWYDAVEFCDRLSEYTGRTYTLPSEAEWEYACRAGTTTPFYFGQTITSELVNYDANYTYGNAPKGEYRQKTTPVGQFPPNAFGLYDMHGNVWEWCLDDWHDSYEGAPTDGSAWIEDKNNLSQAQGNTVLRGGSWNYGPVDCRSACRDYGDRRVDIYVSNGFRVVCGVGRILQ